MPGQQETGDTRWLPAAQRFDHREYKAIGSARHRNIATNAWNMCVTTHTCALGGNSRTEHFRTPERHRRAPRGRHLRELQHRED